MEFNERANANAHFDILHVGPQKSGTTWLFHCFKEHPALALPEQHGVYYFDIGFHRGGAWFDHHFDAAENGKLKVDMTPSYLRDPLAAGRAFEMNPAAKIILCLRDPVARAFSHYWHEKKKKRFNYKFAECLENYDLFCNWVEPGYYATHAARWFDLFGCEQVLLQDFDRLGRDPRGFLREALDFMGVESNFHPGVIDRKVNSATRVRSPALDATRRIVSAFGLESVAREALQSARRLRGGKDIGIERFSDISPEVIAELRRIYEPEITRLESMLGRKLPALRGELKVEALHS